MPSAFETLLQAAEDRSLPPVDRWQPSRSGRIDIRIAADGTWHHDGRPIRRLRLARLFATILRREGSDYYLVTPAEKLRIEVEDAPFVAVDFERDGAGRAQRLLFATSMGDAVVADAAHPIVVESRGDTPRPYVEVRAGLRALIVRSAFYRLVELAETVDGEAVVWSAGTRFVLGRGL